MPDGVADHGKDFGVIVNAKTLTSYVKTNNWEVNPDIHDFTGSGTDDKKSRGGQVQRMLTLGGWTDDDTTDGPRYLETITGDTVTFELHPSGTGSGKRKQTGSLVVGKFVVTGKNDDIFQWTCDLTISGAVTEGTQS
jgi:hypothetical protein